MRLNDDIFDVEKKFTFHSRENLLMKQLRNSTRKNILVQLRQQELSIRQIAFNFGVGYSTVRRIGLENNVLFLKKAGRRKKLSLRDERYCVKKILSGEEKSATSLAKTLSREKKMPINRKTVSRALNNGGLKAKEKKKKPLLSLKNIKARMEFAKKHQDWTVDDWKRVVFSDETKINRFNSDGRSWAWFRDAQELETRTVQQTPKHGGGGVMVWGCILWNGVGYMCKIDGNMDQHLYKSILRDDLMKSINFYHLEKSKIIFQHDNDPKHTSKLVKEWLSEQEFDTLDWPAQSPDLNPIEHMWAEVKRRLNKFDKPPRGVLELWERIQSIWNDIPTQKCQILIQSMPKRIQAVLNAKGKWTKY